MNKQEILEYIQKEKENLYFDRKSAKIEPKDIVRHVIGFANANGGMLAIGVENDGLLSGFSNNMAHSVEEYKMAIMRYCHPVPKFHFEQIKYSKKEKDFVLLIHIDVSTDTVIYGNNEKVYLRNRDNTFELTHSQIISLEYDKGTRFFEDQIVVDADINDIDQDILNEYKEIMSVAEENNKKF